MSHGTVWVAWTDNHYIGYWDLAPDGPPSPLEQMPEYERTADGIEWGRSRAARVIIRPDSDPGTHYWAGAGNPPEDLSHFPIYTGI